MTARLARALFARAFALACAALAFSPPAAAAGLGALPATYSGVLPCADCAGIRHQLNLFPGGAYMLALTYFRDGRDETFYDVGAFAVPTDTSKVQLDAREAKAFQFAVRDGGVLRKLDRDGREISSKLSYDLRREPAFQPIEPRLTLRGSYVYMADAGVLTDCRSGLQFPIAPGGAAADLEKAFLAEKSAREATAAAVAGDSAKPVPPLVVTLRGRIAARPPAGIEGNKPTLFVERMIEAFPGETCGARGVTHPLESTRWVLTRLGADPTRPGPEQREVFLALDSKAKRSAGYSGCNRFTGGYTLGAAGSGKLSFGPAAGTRMACPGPNVETAFLQMLGKVQGYRITGAQLELFDATGATLARFESRNL